MASTPVSLVSEGTLRLLCLLGIAATPGGPAVVGYEEPENGVHPLRLRELRILRNASQRPEGPQFLLTSHSTEVIDALEGEQLFQCSRANGETAFTPPEALPLFARAQVEEAKRGLRGDRESLGQRISRGEL